MRTYTYVEKHGNNIYHRWVEDGEHFSEVTSEFEIPLYLRHPKGTALSLYKEPLIEKTFDSIPEANAFIDRYDGVEGMDPEDGIDDHDGDETFVVRWGENGAIVSTIG